MGVDYSALRERARASWSAGNYPEIAKLLEPAAAELVDACAISAGQAVLDVAAGNGNVAIRAAGEGASVVASDLTPALLEAGRARAEAEGFEIEWVEADAEELPFEDERFDCVTSSFGAMFAPRPERVCRELFRVLRPGGTAAMANWIPGGLSGRLFAINARYLPPPEGVPAPLEWGVEEIVRARFADHAASIAVARRSVRFSFESIAAMGRFFDENSGASIAVREVLEPERVEAMRAEFATVVAELNRADDGTVEIDNDYLLVVARKRG